MALLKLVLALTAITPFLEKVTDPNFVFLGIAILLCGFIAHENAK